MYLVGMSTLSPTARVILGILRFGARTGYDIRKVIEVSTRFFWGASYGQIYPELRRLEQAGLVEAEAEEGRRRRRVYRLTADGERVLHEWLTDRSSFTFEYRDEWVLKLFFGDLLSTDDVLANIRAAREWFTGAAQFFRAEIEPRARAGVEEGELFPFLTYEYGLEFLEWAAEWYERAERRVRREARRRGSRPAESRLPDRRPDRR
jgi:DNA-binding PadR family transcriptional regulator